MDPCIHGEDPLDQKNADGQTDGFSALYSRMTKVWCDKSLTKPHRNQFGSIKFDELYLKYHFDRG